MRRCDKRMAEMLAHRAKYHGKVETPKVNTLSVNGVRVVRGNLEMRSVCFENKKGEKAFGRVLARSADVTVSSAKRVAQPITRSEEPRSRAPINGDIDVALTLKVKASAIDMLNLQDWETDHEAMVELSDRRWNNFLMSARAN